VTRESVGKRMAILLIEKGKGEVITAPVIRSEIPGGRVQISGRMSTTEAADVALLLRAGALAAPMEIIEERTVGRAWAGQHREGLQRHALGLRRDRRVHVGLLCSVRPDLVGRARVTCCFLVALLSLLQATLTLPASRRSRSP